MMPGYGMVMIGTYMGTAGTQILHIKSEVFDMIRQDM